MGKICDDCGNEVAEVMDICPKCGSKDFEGEAQ
jgi:RNA polymerase subunit RPABC4/transcription elongation factor Spt4